MNKGDLINRVCEKSFVTRKEADLIINIILESITHAVASGDTVTLVGFGSFRSRQRKARLGRNPKTGDTIQIPTRRVPVFSAGKYFKNKVNN